MLYITTVNQNDAYTAHRTLTADRAPDGALFVPFHLPKFDSGDLIALTEKNTGQIIADILNLFFSCGLSGWDVDFCIGKNPIKVKTMNHKLLLAEVWHNHAARYQYIESALFSRISLNQSKNDIPTEWFHVASQIAVLFAVFAEFMKQNIVDLSQPVDIAVPSDDFSAPISALYARKMGLPIATIICSCDDNSPVWDLIQRGEINGTSVNRPEGLERLIQNVFGCNEACAYKRSYNNGATYTLCEEGFKLINKAMFAAVIGKDRIPSVINSMYRTNEYLIDEKTALIYAGLQDFRTRVSTGNSGLLLSFDCPEHSIDQISKATGISSDKLKLNR